jgi:prepilin peptidase CpaA
MLLLYACFAGLLTLLILAALTDLRERRIPNWLTASAAALYPVYLMLSPGSIAWLGALGLSLLVGVVGLALFARELVGGGDVKLIAALSLWAGLEHFTMFALVTSLTGGLLSLAMLWFQRWSPLIHAHVAGFGLANASARPDSAALAAGERPASATLPYGIAIAAGGVAVVIELMKKL